MNPKLILFLLFLVAAIAAAVYVVRTAHHDAAPAKAALQELVDAS